VVIAVAGVLIVEMVLDDIVKVTCVGHGFVAAGGRVAVPGLVRGAVMTRSAIRRVFACSTQLMLVGMPLMGVMQVSVVKVIGMTIMFHTGMATIFAMHVPMRFVQCMRHLCKPPGL
jgi:hypothetical protein